MYYVFNILDVKKIVNACPNLVEFDLSDCTIITGASVAHIACSLESLEHLSLSRCYAIQPSEFE
jgi:F-box and leucine-rich repeat protein 1 (S-phase kinase-associated protein 2)